MKRITLVLAALCGILGWAGSQSAEAQPFPSLPPGMGSYTNRGPALSPYLNLRRNRASDYFLGVLPESDRRFNLAEQRAFDRGLERQIIEGRPEVVEEVLGPFRAQVLPPTGHSTSFGNLLGEQSVVSRDLEGQLRARPDLSTGHPAVFGVLGTYSTLGTLPGLPGRAAAGPPPRRR